MDQNDPGRPTSSNRRRFLASAGATAVGAGLATLSASGGAQAQSVAYKQAGNNNHIIELQKGGGEAVSGKVVLDYFGHTSFRITTPKGLTLAFDPWRNDPTGAWGLWFPKEYPRTKVDIGLSTHTHFDHDAIDRLDATTLLDRLVGTWSFADVTITGVADKHATSSPGWYKWINAVKESGQDPYPPNNPGHLDNVSYLVETGGVRILIWGDNRHNPSDDVWTKWGRVDVLTLPVDGSQHILSYDQGNAVVDRLKPKIVIPTHYLNEGTSSTLSTLQTADEWVAAQKNKRKLDSATLVLEAGGLAGLDREFNYFGSHVSRG